MKDAQIKDDIVRLARSLFDRGLSFGSSGNISVRTQDGWLMTPAGSSMGSLDPERISRLDRDGNWLSGDQPTKESFLHMSMYGKRSKANAIVHLHSTHSVAVSCLHDIDTNNVLPPLTAYSIMRLGKVKLLPYFRPGDPAMGDAVRGLAGKRSAVMLAAHGPVVAGKDIEAAVYAIEELEETAKLSMLLKGYDVNLLTPEQISDVVTHFNVEWD